MGNKSREKMAGSLEFRKARNVFRSFLVDEANNYLVTNAERFLKWS